jgi:hypothetical protein
MVTTKTMMGKMVIRVAPVISRFTAQAPDERMHYPI